MLSRPYDRYCAFVPTGSGRLGSRAGRRDDRIRRPQSEDLALTDALNFSTDNNACLSLHIIAERLRSKDARIIIANIRDTGVLELKISGAFHIDGGPEAAVVSQFDGNLCLRNSAWIQCVMGEGISRLKSLVLTPIWVVLQQSAINCNLGQPHPPQSANVIGQRRRFAFLASRGWRNGSL